MTALTHEIREIAPNPALEESRLWQSAPGLQLINKVGINAIPVILSYLDGKQEDREFCDIFESLYQIRKTADNPSAQESFLWQNAPGLQLINKVGINAIPVILSYLEMDGEDPEFCDIFKSLEKRWITVRYTSSLYSRFHTFGIDVHREADALQKPFYPICEVLDTHFPKDVSRLVLSYFEKRDLDEFKTLSLADRRAIAREQFLSHRRMTFKTFSSYIEQMSAPAIPAEFRFTFPEEFRFTLDLGNECISTKLLHEIANRCGKNIKGLEFEAEDENDPPDPTLVLTDDHLQMLPTLFPNIHSLELHSLAITPRSLPNLAQLSDLTSLLVTKNVGEEGILHLMKCPRLKNLTLFTPTIPMIKACGQLPELTHLCLNWPEESELNFKDIVDDLARCKTLTSLDWNGGFDPDDFALLHRLPLLQILDIDNYMDEIPEVEIPPPFLTSLKVGGVSVPFHIRNFPSLRHLRVGSYFKFSKLEPYLNDCALESIELYSVFSTHLFDKKELRIFLNKNPQISAIRITYPRQSFILTNIPK